MKCNRTLLKVVLDRLNNTVKYERFTYKIGHIKKDETKMEIILSVFEKDKFGNKKPILAITDVVNNTIGRQKAYDNATEKAMFELLLGGVIKLSDIAKEVVEEGEP